VLIPDLAEDGRFREHFLREAQIAASLDEPHIVPTLAMGEHDGMLYLVTSRPPPAPSMAAETARAATPRRRRACT
jgi:hypothetical protein